MRTYTVLVRTLRMVYVCVCGTWHPVEKRVNSDGIHMCVCEPGHPAERGADSLSSHITGHYVAL